MGNDTTAGDPVRVQLRRYPNRRYYDAAQSQHLTLDDIFRLVCEGHQVQVSDSKTGEDITVRVLAQLILEQAPSKLAALPAELLHQIIRSNESLLREFIDKYFYRAFSAFIESQREYDRYLRQALALTTGANGPGAPSPAASFPFFVPNWTAMMGSFAAALLARDTDVPRAEPSSDRGNDQSEVMTAVEELKREVESLRKELNNRGKLKSLPT